MQTSKAGTSASLNGGFTLIEMLVVIFILSIIALLVYPKLPSAGDRGELRSSARSIAATIRYLENLAITSKGSYRIWINLDDSTLAIKKIGADGSEETAPDLLLSRKLLAGEIRIADVISSRIGKITSGKFPLDFGPMGLREFVTIHLLSTKGHYYAVQAYPRSGRVKVFDNYSGGVT
ncbi:MAG: prepilin-type N-terminal cleavage/methylation domain-containing protein [Deltaproteobacteria bacterium]